MTKKSKTRTEKRFSGPLGEPMRLPTNLRNLEIFARAVAPEMSWDPNSPFNVTPERVERMMLLARKYGVHLKDTNAWFWVAFRLACDCVPGFRYEPYARGRNVEWTLERFRQLVDAVDDLISRRGLSARSACKVLATKGQFKKVDGSPLSGQTLYRRYEEATRSNFITHAILMLRKISG